LVVDGWLLKEIGVDRSGVVYEIRSMRKHLFIPALAFMVAVVLSLPSCDKGTITDPQDIVFPDSGVSYHHDVQPLFDLSCAFSGCHDEYSRAGGLSLRSYSDVISRTGLVLPGDSTGSVLRQIVRGVLPHTYPITALVNENQIHGIAVWIQEGAHNN
jgi:hypothetical protein